MDLATINSEPYTEICTIPPFKQSEPRNTIGIRFQIRLPCKPNRSNFGAVPNSAGTRVKISLAITGLLAQQPCNNTVNMIEQDW